MENKLIKIKTAIQGIKTSQASQHDSYTFYAYKTGNICRTDGRVTKITFEPTLKNRNNVLCVFNLEDYCYLYNILQVDVVDRFTAYVKGLNPTADAHISDNTYVTVVSNSEGYIKTEVL